MSDELWAMRDDYKNRPLEPEDLSADPIEVVKAWMQAAVRAQTPHANAMTLATVDERGRPAARIVLLKGIDATGFTFFTNYDSRKGRDLASHPFAALVLFWEPLNRQIRIEGAIERVPAHESDAYFATRPRGSQIGAAASPQSHVLADRGELEALVAEVTQRVGDGAVPRPDNWGGYRVVPDMIEAWQGQTSRLHDRIRYTRNASGWTRVRLAP